MSSSTTPATSSASPATDRGRSEEGALMEARSFVLRGVLAGAVAGLVAWLFSLVFAEPQIEAAIAYEEGRGAAEEALAVAAGAAPAGSAGEEVVSRGVQGTIGLGVGMVGIGIALGLLFAV